MQNVTIADIPCVERSFFMDRRSLIASGLSLPLAGATRALAADPISIADMHFHSYSSEGFPHSRVC
jgi:hypothetical protein